jgi:CubicO group peptidase (beta-lactamase class C family)
VRLKVLVVTCFAIGSLALCWSQEFAQTADKYVSDLASQGQFRGVVFVERDGRVLLEKGYGLAVEGWKLPNTPTTKFEIASLTKQFTAAAILQLSESGKLRIDDHVAKFYSQSPASWKDITIQQLLTHTSGLPNNEIKDFKMGICVPYTTEQLIETFRDRPLESQPGTVWHYTNTEYYLLAFIIEKVSGESYGAYLQRHIFMPAGMSDSGFEPILAVVPGEAEGYSPEGDRLRHRDYFDRSLEIGAGGIYTTVGDLWRWNEALDSAAILNSESVKQMFTLHPPGNYGYGWFIQTTPPLKSFHEGNDPGFAAFEARYPQQHALILVLANQDNAPVRKMADELENGLFR